MTHKIDMEIEPNAPDWSNEIPSDHLLAHRLKDKLTDPALRDAHTPRERRRIKMMLEKLRNLGFGD